MRVTVWLLGREVFSVSTDCEEAETAEQDFSRDLSGGTTGSLELGVGFVPRFLGETGMEGTE